MALSTAPEQTPQKKSWKRPALRSVEVQVPMNLMICTPPQLQCPNDSGCYNGDPCSECAGSC